MGGVFTDGVVARLGAAPLPGDVMSTDQEHWKCPPPPAATMCTPFTSSRHGGGARNAQTVSEEDPRVPQGQVTLESLEIRLGIRQRWHIAKGPVR